MGQNAFKASSEIANAGAFGVSQAGAVTEIGVEESYLGDDYTQNQLQSNPYLMIADEENKLFLTQLHHKKDKAKQNVEADIDKLKGDIEDPFQKLLDEIKHIGKILFYVLLVIFGFSIYELYKHRSQVKSTLNEGVSEAKSAIKSVGQTAENAAKTAAPYAPLLLL